MSRILGAFLASIELSASFKAMFFLSLPNRFAPVIEAVRLRFTDFLSALFATIAFAYFAAKKLENVSGNDESGTSDNDRLRLKNDLPDMIGIATVDEVIDQPTGQTSPTQNRDQVKHTYLALPLVSSILVFQQINSKEKQSQQKQSKDLLALRRRHNSGRRSFRLSITRDSCSGPSVRFTARIVEYKNSFKDDRSTSRFDS